MNFLSTIADYRFDPFNLTFSARAIGTGGNPVEEKKIPLSGPFFVFLDELPRKDTPSTLLINEKGGPVFAEVSVTTAPAAGQFRAIFGGDGITVSANVGQGTVEFNPVDAGKTIEIKYFGLGSILQRDFFFRSMDTIATQQQFNDSIVRTGANTYRFRDDIQSLRLKIIDGGYLMSGVLSGGDLFGNLETNQVTNLEFEPGAFIDFENERGRLTILTAGMMLKNVDLRGTGTVASAITESFLLVAPRVTFDNCKTSNRLSNGPFKAFNGSGVASHNETSKYIGCSAINIKSSDVPRGFSLCQNLVNCLVDDLASTGNAAIGYSACINLSNCIVSKIDNAVLGSVNGFSACKNLASCEAFDVDGLDPNGFVNCFNLSSCKAFDIEAIAGGVDRATGFNICNRMSACEALDINSPFGTVRGYENCINVSACIADGITGLSGEICGFCFGAQVSGCEARNVTSQDGIDAMGFRQILRISACSAFQINADSGDAHGFENCDLVAGNFSDQIISASGNANGMKGCNRISSCFISVITAPGGVANGYLNCNYISSSHSLTALNNNNNKIDTDDVNVSQKFSTDAIWT